MTYLVTLGAGQEGYCFLLLCRPCHHLLRPRYLAVLVPIVVGWSWRRTRNSRRGGEDVLSPRGVPPAPRCFGIARLPLGGCGRVLGGWLGRVRWKLERRLGRFGGMFGGLLEGGLGESMELLMIVHSTMMVMRSRRRGGREL